MSKRRKKKKYPATLKLLCTVTVLLLGAAGYTLWHIGSITLIPSLPTCWSRVMRPTITSVMNWNSWQKKDGSILSARLYL